MFIHEVPGSWLDHPFWRASFKLTDPRQMHKLRQAVTHLVIDTSKGLDIETEAAATAGVEQAPSIGQAAPATPVQVATQPAPELPASSGFHDEIQLASKIVAQSREAMRDLYHDARMGKAVDARHCLPLVEDITQSVVRNPLALVSLARLKTRDDYTYMHSVAVCALMISLARQLGMDDAATRQAGLGGLVHDIGKARMPPDVLNKPGPLTPEEFSIMKSHPEAGHGILVEGQGASDVPLDICLHHHEKVNGTGYPHGLRGEEISLHARVGAVCDVYDAITSNRPYKAGWDPAQALHKMALWTKEGHFDEQVFHAFVKSVGIYPTGSLVKLDSGLLGVVVAQGAASLLQPLVRVFYSAPAKAPVAPRLIDLGVEGGSERIVSRESPEAWGLENTEAFWLTPQT